MNYLIVQDWSNTTNNHAGMKYLCCQLAKLYPNEYKVYVIKDYYKDMPERRLAKKIFILKAKWKLKNRFKDLYLDLNRKLKFGDTVFLMEYMESLCPQLYLAKMLKKLRPEIRIFAMVHLVPSKLDSSFNNAKFKKWTNYIDYIITMGSSLTEYLSKRGFPLQKIITAFHYVDNDYYRKESILSRSDCKQIKVIAMGNQMRNIRLLKDVILNNPNVKFIVCQGVNNLRNYFSDCNNVELIKFVPEDKLKEYMKDADISLNVMKDTIGSNVIVTSMAMGLALVCSNVGSIKDYCDSTNSILCNNDNVDDFTNAIRKLCCNRLLLEQMKLKSLEKSRSLSIVNFHNYIKLQIEERPYS